ncbi:MAG: substrate binding domain-containing protein, partial [Pseudomonadota bacterium]
ARATKDLDTNTPSSPFPKPSFRLAIRIGELPDSTLVARRLGATKYALYASPSYLQSAPRLRTVADLPSQRVFAMSESVDRIRLRMQRGSERTTVSVPSAGAVNDFPILVQMLVDGLGIAALPDHLARASVDAGTLKRVLPSWSLGVSEFNAVFPSHRGATPKVRAFVDYLVEALSKTAPWKP